ncbi:MULTISPECIES: hypothetical protein [Cyanophyceae]|uniref:hypothetical protein n=1 Tax=Cyanophyceae TaxID=3028117 RepID=UPI00168839AD|nr:MULTISPECIES: hypothetical protein [Cyanophyceae]MBD1917433.1 hypothetical protein [Phormidium sp. FACHB-77]MBD2032322.1 hypothetical protein [Phormidium sp. FACHB-322]MBD2052260.1 hypothetical protein [Leptolyngbya sp. FACHB-60]
MKTTHVEFSALFNLGDYNNEKIGFRCQLEEGDTVEAAVEHLRNKAIELSAGKGKAQDFYSNIWEEERKLRDLESKVKAATEQWNQVANFLRAQGLNPDAPNLPTLPALTPGQPDEVEVEIDVF